LFVALMLPIWAFCFADWILHDTIELNMFLSVGWFDLNEELHAYTLIYYCGINPLKNRVQQ
jgi:hypothetical protein